MFVVRDQTNFSRAGTYLIQESRITQLYGGLSNGDTFVLVAVLTKNRALLDAISVKSADSGNPVVLHFDDGIDLIRHVMNREAVDLVVVDADTDIEAVARLSAWKTCHARKDFAILVIGQLLRPETMALALELGGDDLVAGPFNVNELYARAARCVARLNSRAANGTQLELGGYALDKRTGCVTYESHELLLTEREFALAWLFFSNPGVLLSRPRIAAAIWGTGGADMARSLGSYLYKLRGKLGLAKEGAVTIRAVYSSGYRLEVLRGVPRAKDGELSTASGLTPSARICL